ncbi:hypothetical protein AN403_4550 [Pseudomonas fluorescens]|uniref:Uncharacterized protein n=1 Tax=Pseudomonas fluorescens TaxID=294 RepID=A0A0P8XJL4_PSEFL|nr:type I restriction-modification system endonuclease [Pseudomonas fluorescens]KPU60332.1 hypothetical protein AN403_4550 [Pseudomonas fluorescens]
MPESKNFSFLQEHDPVFLRLAQNAEQAFVSDPNTTLIKLRQLGEAIAQDLATRVGVEFTPDLKQIDLLSKLGRELQLSQDIRNLFHTLRIEGNKATHTFHTQHREAMDGLRVARDLAIWYHRSFGKKTSNFKAGPFVTPLDPSLPLRELQKQIDELKSQLISSHQQLETSQQLTQLIEREKEEYAVLAEQMDVEARNYKQLTLAHAEEMKQAQQDFELRLAELKKQLAAQPQAMQLAIQQTKKASDKFDPDEDVTRVLIDKQLNAAGWDADSEELTYQRGARPERGKNKAIAEWPTVSGRKPADYMLFIGLTPVAIVEAKRQRINVANCVPQAERYSREFTLGADQQGAWLESGRTTPWPDGQTATFQLPFAFACNGRPRVKQLEESSGVWFRDLRHSANLRRPLDSFHTPRDLLDQLQRSREDSEAKLRNEGFSYLNLRDYQEKAIQAVELALEKNQRECLLAMATGTGKTRTIIGLIYRLLKTERFKRILFLVDRSALGIQAQEAFNDMTLEQNQTLAQIYGIKHLGDMASEAETRVQVATVQAMVRRIFQSENPLPVGEFDCIIVDEAHRGYTLDQEMTEGELAVRDYAQYLSQYRRVLDHFDACKIALTATPAKHTSEIFGKPIYTYSYREAVADDWLIDHDPPIRFKTKLGEYGIHFKKGDEVSVIDTKTGQVDVAELEDELDFEIESFNRSVITADFDRVVCEQLAREIDPIGEERMREKTLVFCVNQLHAERVKGLLDQAFKDVHGEEYTEAAVQIITGRTDQVQQIISLYKNERFPNVAITVDLLTTGIDVPQISNLVFMRRVRSRILYEQMKGRATRRCDDIGKTVFKIFDPVDLYAALEEVDTMKPLVKDPGISIEQLICDLNNEDSYDAPGNIEDTSHAHDALDQLSQRVMRILRKAVYKAETNPKIKLKLDELEAAWGVKPEELHAHLHELGPREAVAFINRNSHFLTQLAQVSVLLGSINFPIISIHEDAFIGREQSYGNNQKPKDYLESFDAFIREQLNTSIALSVVVNRPKDLTREHLREIRLLLDEHGFSQSHVESAWASTANHEIAASIIGYIRKAAIGEALVPFDQRVRTAMATIYNLVNWTPVQKKWLARLADQLVHEVILDEQRVQSLFQRDGGVPKLDKMLDGNLSKVLGALQENLWLKAV